MSNLENNTTELESLLEMAFNLPTAGAGAVQSDWAQTDESQLDYIKNKPGIDTEVNSESENLITSKAVYNAINALDAEDVGALSEQTLGPAIESALTTAKESGEFDGEDGAPGPQGPEGPEGPQGPAGETPKKGEDYFTEQDKNEFLEQVKTSIDIPQYVTDLLDSENYATKTWAEEILNGKCKAYVFDFRDVGDPNYIINTDREEVLNQWLEDIDISILNTGDVFLIRDVEVPDYWWDGETQSKQILETTKVVLTDYAKLSDIPTKVSKLENDSNFIDKTTFDEALAEVEKPFVITATIDLENMALTNVSRTFDEIMQAYNRKDHVFLDLDISQMMPGQHFQVALNSISESHMLFETIVNLNAGAQSAHVMGLIQAGGHTSFEIIPLVQSTQIGGLTFVTSDTVPTVDDRSIITFVIEG